MRTLRLTVKNDIDSNCDHVNDYKNDQYNNHDDDQANEHDNDHDNDFDTDHNNRHENDNDCNDTQTKVNVNVSDQFLVVGAPR